MAHKTYPIRTRFSKSIVAEVKMPSRQRGKIAILVGGLPSRPVAESVLSFFAEQGYVAVAPRFEGTWESDGVFLAHSPAHDIKAVIDELARHKHIADLYTGERIRISVKAFHLFGASFGGPAVLLNAAHPKVRKVVALAPVIDWTKDGANEPFAFWTKLAREAFGSAYRPRSFTHWRKLLQRDFYTPDPKGLSRADAAKVFILHARDDQVVPIGPLLDFCETSGVRAYLKPKGGHFGMRQFTQMFYWKKIAAFLDAR